MDAYKTDWFSLEVKNGCLEGHPIHWVILKQYGSRGNKWHKGRKEGRRRYYVHRKPMTGGGDAWCAHTHTIQHGLYADCYLHNFNMYFCTNTVSLAASHRQHDTQRDEQNTKWIKLEHLPLTCNHGCNMELNIWEIKSSDWHQMMLA